MKHRHAELMMEYARDALETERPWERWQIMCVSINTRVADVRVGTFHDPFDKSPFKCKSDNNVTWRDLSDPPTWNPVNQYRRKPRTININGFEVPEPVRNPLNIDDEYYVVRPDRECHFHRGTWDNSQAEHIWLGLSLIHLTIEAAIKHAEALLSFTRIER